MSVTFECFNAKLRTDDGRETDLYLAERIFRSVYTARLYCTIDIALIGIRFRCDCPVAVFNARQRERDRDDIIELVRTKGVAIACRG